MAKTLVLEGKYKGKQVVCSSVAVAIVTGFLKNIELKKDNVKSIEIITEEHSKSAASGVGRGLIGGALLGPVGLLAGAFSAKTKGKYMIAVEWTDGEKSLIEVDEKGYKALQIKLF